jgi:hypothetical protein
VKQEGEEEEEEEERKRISCIRLFISFFLSFFKGQIRVRLYVSSDRNDTDFTVKVTDVYPPSISKRKAIIVDHIQRMRYREGNDKVVLMHPHQVRRERERERERGRENK